MSQYVGIERAWEFKVVHCSPDVLTEALAPAISPAIPQAQLDSQLTAHRRPNPANGAPRPKNHNPVA